MPDITTKHILSTPSHTHFLVGLAMIIAAVISLTIKPTHMVAEQKSPINLETMIPKQFKGWRLDDSIVPLIANPQQTATLKKIYAQTLTRTYVNDQGQRIMLSIAFGSNQREGLEVHRPEVCYVAQGFHIGKLTTEDKHNNMLGIPVKRMVAVKGARIEPITYWIVIDNKVASDSWQWKFERLKLGLQGIIPDGLLFRVSMISGDEASSYEIQNKFISELFDSLKSDDQKKIFGSITR